MKKARMTSAEAALPPQPYPAMVEDDRAWFKLQNLKQDYEDLLKDAEVKRRRLTIARQRALKLKGEVRFLRRRYEFLMHNASPTPYRLKSHPRQSSNAPKHREKMSVAAVNAVRQHDKSHMAGEAAVPKTSPVLDLNQISFPEGEEEEEFHVPSDATPMESSRRYLTEGDAVAVRAPKPTSESSSRIYPAEVDVAGGLLKSPICRDAGNGSSRRGKRKVSWQDQVALKV